MICEKYQLVAGTIKVLIGSDHLDSDPIKLYAGIKAYCRIVIDTSNGACYYYIDSIYMKIGNR